MKQAQIERMQTGNGFIAALDQSGGSTPKALKLYGIDESQYSNEEEMFDLMHQMRTRIMTSPAFTSEHILGAILFCQTMGRKVEGIPTTEYLLNKGILPFLKVDLGLADLHNDVRLMKPITNLDEVMEQGVDNQIFGTKMRSVIMGANAAGIREVVAQQFEFAKRILGYGIVPIIEPEVDINIPDKEAAEAILQVELADALKNLSPDQKVVFKLTIPNQTGLYDSLLEDDHLVRIVALSGGYSRTKANELLAQNHKMIASFSRALTEGLTAQQSDDEFNKMLGESIQAIAAASAE